MIKNYSWYGVFDDSTLMNLKALCYDLDCKFSEYQEHGKQHFMLKDLNVEQSMFLVSNIKKYDLTVLPEEPGRVLPVAIKMSLDILLSDTK